METDADQPDEKPRKPKGPGTMATERLNKAEADEDKATDRAFDAKDDTIAAWTWIAKAAGIAAAAGWGTFAVFAALVIGMTQFNLQLPGGIGLSLSREANVSDSRENAAEPGE